MLAFHHFSDSQTEEILRRALVAKAPVAIFDITVPGLLNHLPRLIGYLMLPLALILNLFIPLLVIVATPAVRPFQSLCILLTYVLPFIPLYIWRDATISILRAKHVNGLVRLASEADPEQAFLWYVGGAPGIGPRSLTYLLARLLQPLSNQPN